MLADHRWIRLLSINSVCVVPRCKGGGIKALRAAAVVHNTSPVGGKGGGSGRGTGGAGACGSASPGCSGRGKPNDGTSLGRATVWRVGGPDADVPRGGAVRRAGARERALASMPCFQIQSSHVWTPNSFKFENKL
jgi:hypothetical protein